VKLFLSEPLNPGQFNNSATESRQTTEAGGCRGRVDVIVRPLAEKTAVCRDACLRIGSSTSGLQCSSSGWERLKLKAGRLDPPAGRTETLEAHPVAMNIENAGI